MTTESGFDWGHEVIVTCPKCESDEFPIHPYDLGIRTTSIHVRNLRRAHKKEFGHCLKVVPVKTPVKLLDKLRVELGNIISNF